MSKHAFSTNVVSDYIWHEKLNWRADHVRNTTLSKMKVIDAFDDGIVTYSDLYIVYVIHVMTYANLYQIAEYTKWWKTQCKDLPLNPADDMEAFKSRIENLVKNSFLRRYKFVNNEGKDRDYYFVTPNGYNFIKKKLYFKEKYDEYLGAAPVQEVLKYLANNELLVKILNNVSMEQGYHMESKSFYSSHVQYYDKSKRKNIITYGFLNIPIGDRKVKILIEPYRPTFDVNVFAKGQMDQIQNDRFDFLNKYIDEFDTKNIGNGSLKVIFVAEDVHSARKLAAYISTLESYIRANMMVTVDKVVQQHGLSKTFLKLIDKPEDNKTGLGLTSLDISRG